VGSRDGRAAGRQAARVGNSLGSGAAPYHLEAQVLAGRGLGRTCLDRTAMRIERA
jgi:hypothetical protein